MLSYYDKTLNRKILYNENMFIHDLSLKQTGGNDYKPRHSPRHQDRHQDRQYSPRHQDRQYSPRHSPRHQDNDVDKNLPVVYPLLYNENAKRRLLFAINESFQYGNLVARDLLNKRQLNPIYKPIELVSLCNEPSLLQQVKKIYQLHDVITITEYDISLDEHHFLNKWFRFLGVMFYPHNKREILDSLKSAGYNTTVRTMINSLDTNPLFKYYIDCSKIDSAREP